MEVVKTTQLTEILVNSGLEKETSLMIKSSMEDFYNDVQKWKDAVYAIKVNSALQVDDMKKAGEARKELKRIRVAADKKRKELKADALSYGKVVQNVYNLIEGEIKPLEQYAEQQEKYIEIQEELRLAKIREERAKSLDGLYGFLPFEPSSYPYEKLPDDEFTSIMEEAMFKKEEVEQQIRMEEERKIKEAKEREEERLRLIEENKKMQAQLKETEDKLKEEQSKVKEYPVTQEESFNPIESVNTTDQSFAEEIYTYFKNALQEEDTDCGNEVLCSILATKFSLATVDFIIKSKIRYLDLIMVKKAISEIN